MEAHEHRSEARVRARSAESEQAEADEAAARAKKARAVAEEQAAQARRAEAEAEAKADHAHHERTQAEELHGRASEIDPDGDGEQNAPTAGCSTATTRSSDDQRTESSASEREVPAQQRGRTARAEPREPEVGGPLTRGR